jgi:broad specificity phosphatase PhoE
VTDPTLPEVYVVRHGATEWSVDGRHTGSTDLPLLPEGEQQATDAGEALAGIEFSMVLSSPLRRALRTCQLAGLGARVEIDDDLREWSYGAYEGITSTEIHRTDPGWTVWEGICPDGETIGEVAARADRVIARVREQSGTTIVFAHGHFLRVFTARWCGLDPVEGRRFLLDPATVSILGWEHGIAAVRRWNSR